MTNIDLHHHVTDVNLHHHMVEIMLHHIINPGLLLLTEMLMILVTQRIGLNLSRETTLGRREGPLADHIGTNRSNQV